MGNDNGDRCEASESKLQQASELVACFLRALDSANAYVIELRDAVARAHRQRAAQLRADIDTAWKLAEAAIAKLERSGPREAIARAVLTQSQEAARPVFAELWSLVMSGNERADTTINE